MGGTDLVDRNDKKIGYKIGLRAKVVVLFIYMVYIYIYLKRLDPSQKIKPIPVSIKI